MSWTPHTSRDSLEPVFTIAEPAAELSVSTQALHDLRSKARGRTGFVVGRQLRDDRRLHARLFFESYALGEGEFLVLIMRMSTCRERSDAHPARGGDAVPNWTSADAPCPQLTSRAERSSQVSRRTTRRARPSRAKTTGIRRLPL